MARSKKMGRPKLEQAKRRVILMQARFSPEEAKQLQAAIAKFPGSKSEWMRTALLSVAKGSN
jgi:hypothetical protein